MENLKTNEGKKDIFELLPVLEKLDPQQRELFKIYTSDNLLLLSEEETVELTNIASEKLGGKKVLEVVNAAAQYEDAREVQEKKVLSDFADLIKGSQNGSSEEVVESVEDVEVKGYDIENVEASVSESIIVESGKELNMKVAKRSRFVVKNGSKLTIKVAVGCNIDVEGDGIVDIEVGKGNNITKL